MIRKKMALLISLVLVAGLLHQTGSFASEIDEPAFQEEETTREETSSSEEATVEAETTQETETEADPITELEIIEGQIDVSDDLEEKETDLQQDDNENIPDDAINILQENIIGQDISGQGFSCYLNLYLYEYQKKYLDAYSEYLSKKKAVYEELYASGEITNDAVLDSAAQLAACVAQKSILDNESEYCRLYLEEYKLNFDDLEIEKEKTIQDREYYETKQTEMSRMQIARYIANFQNAKALLNAKEIEITSINEKAKMQKLLYEAGEITELEKMEEEVLLKKAEYEKAQYYVNLNEAYYYLEYR